MAENSAIEWCTHTFNPWIGCTKVSDGCKFCYAKTLMDDRYGKVKWGPDGTRSRTSELYWRQPAKWDRTASRTGERHRVFCASLADVFEDRPELVPWRHNLFRLILCTPNLDWLLLTKRPENALPMMAECGLYEVANLHLPRPQSNIWVGTSVEDQATANERIPHLLNCPASVRFLSCEPLLAPIDFSAVGVPTAAIDWMIVGGESGPGARPMALGWARDIVAHCKATDTACFVKQLGANPFDDGPETCPHIRDPKGGDPSEWPAELRVRQLPGVTSAASAVATQ